MGLFEALFGSSKPSASNQLGTSASPQAMKAYYDIATNVIPARLFRDENHILTGGRTFIKSFLNPSEPVILDLMLELAGTSSCIVPPNEMSNFEKNFHPICGDINNKLKYLIIEYPKPLQMKAGSGAPVIAPFYSAFVYSEVESSVRYYLLRMSATGQLDIGTAREIFHDGTSFNLGFVSSQREDYIAFIKRIETSSKPICAGSDKNGEVVGGGIEVLLRYFPQAFAPGFRLICDPTTGQPFIPASWRPVLK